MQKKLSDESSVSEYDIWGKVKHASSTSQNTNYKNGSSSSSSSVFDNKQDGCVNINRYLKKTSDSNVVNKVHATPDSRYNPLKVM